MMQIVVTCKPEEEIIVEKQLPISDADKIKLIDLRQQMFNDKVGILSESMYVGDISIGQWEESMKKAIREVHASVTAIAKGGWDSMSSADWGRIGTPLREQYKYLHAFANDISKQRETISLKAIQARARLYGLASSGTAAIVQAGPELANMLPWMPRDGTTECFFETDKVRALIRDKGFIRLASVKVGDYVLSHLGHFKKVLEITSTNVVNVNSVKLYLHVGDRKVKVSVTPDHLFRTIDGWIRADEIDETTKLARIGKKCKRVGCNVIVNVQSHYDKDACCSHSCDSIANKKWIKAHEKNHDGDYKLVDDVEILSISRKIRSGTVKCLVVEDDESFVATAGLISHNCLMGCKCFWKFKTISKDPKSQTKIVSAVWKLSPAEHCETCKERRDHEEILTLPIDYEVPPFIGGY